MITALVDIIKHQLGDHFASYVLLIGGTLYVIHIGVKEIQKWVINDIVNPILKPIQDELTNRFIGNENMLKSHGELLIDHEDRLRNQERISSILQGKVLGGRVVSWKDNDESDQRN